MKKVLAAFVAAAFSLSIAGAAAPAQVNHERSAISQVQDQATPKKKKKVAKKTEKKKTEKKKQTAKKPGQKKKAT